MASEKHGRGERHVVRPPSGNRVRKAVVVAAAKAEARGWDMSMTEAEAKKKILADNGVNVAAPSAGLKADLAKVGETMLADWLRETGDEGKAVIGAFRN